MRLAPVLLVLTLAACVAPAPERPAPVATAPGLAPPVAASPMLATQTIAANVATAPELRRFAAAVQGADLAQTLSGAGPYTVFAPTDDAFGRLMAGTVEELMKPERKAALAKVVGYHVVPGTIDFDELRRQIAAGSGTATLTTLGGQALTFRMEGAALAIVDARGNVAYAELADVRQANGVVHVVNGVLLPKM